MNTTGITELESVYEAAIKAITDLSSKKLNKKKSLHKIFAPSFLIYGMGEDEKYMSFNDFPGRLKGDSRISRLPEINMPMDSTPVFRSYSPDLRSAVYVDELQYLSVVDDVSQTIHLRISIVLNKLEEGWRVTHLHASRPSTASGKTGLKQQEYDKQNTALQKQVKQQSAALNEAREAFAANQAQLVRQEKLASLGQLTAGIAHEIKNPLNFITNFSELSAEFVEEIEENVDKLEKSEVTEEILALLEDVKGNLKKIYSHGTRADGIVRSMLLHSRGGNGEMEDTDLNALIREYVNLSFHGMRANKNPINVDIRIETEDSLGPVLINAENFSRVILNLCKNAFDAMREKQQRDQSGSYLPKLTVRTKKQNDKVIVEIEDNGPGIPDEIKEKMMLPFFTTKKGSDGTGLGLSISQDIIKDHNGKLRILTKQEEGTVFIIELPKK